MLVGFLAALSSVAVGTLMGALAGLYAGRPLRFYDGPFARLSVPARGAFALWHPLSWLLFYALLYGAARLAWTFSGEAFQARWAGEWSNNATLSTIGLFTAWGALGLLGFRGLTAQIRLDLDVVISRLIDFMLTLPSLPIFLVLLAILRDPRSPVGNLMYGTFGSASSVVIIIMILVLFGWITTARLVRASFLSLREREFAMAAQALGSSNGGVMFRHLAPIIVEGTLQVRIAILVEAALSFFRFGIPPPVSIWGDMLNKAQAYIFYAPWLAFPPAGMIVITVLAINFLGDGLRDAFDLNRRR